MTHERHSTVHCRLGDVSRAVADLRGRLVVLGLVEERPPSVERLGPDGFMAERFDEQLDRAVRHFQQRRGLTVDGLVGPETMRQLDEARWRLGDRALTYSVSRPITGDDVARLQERLQQMGFEPGTANGVYGPETARAVSDFQRDTGLKADGLCGPATLAALDRLARTVVGGHPQQMRETERLYDSGPGLAGKLVVLDPGHGGTDTGAALNGATESDLVWDIASRLDGRLSALGVHTYLTRSATVPATEAERIRFANATDADLVVSLHLEAAESSRARGASTYYFGHDRYGWHSPTGRRFAELALRELVARCGLVDNRSHARTWTLLRGTRMPTVRVELGHLSNPHEAEHLRSAAFRAQAVEALAAAVQRLYLPPEDDAPTGMLRLPSFAP